MRSNICSLKSDFISLSLYIMIRVFRKVIQKRKIMLSSMQNHTFLKDPRESSHFWEITVCATAWLYVQIIKHNRLWTNTSHLKERTSCHYLPQKCMKKNYFMSHSEQKLSFEWHEGGVFISRLIIPLWKLWNCKKTTKVFFTFPHGLRDFNWKEFPH